MKQKRRCCNDGDLKLEFLIRSGRGFVQATFSQKSPFRVDQRRLSGKSNCNFSGLRGLCRAGNSSILAPGYAEMRELKIARASETRSLCPYCAVGCGVIIYTLGDRAKNVTPQVVHVEGDPDHPTNRGTLCPKGSSLEQDI